MATTKLDLRAWFEQGKRQGARYMIVVCDTFDHEDYPSYVMPHENIHDRISYYKHSPMQRITEVYNLTLDRDKQLNENRSFNHPPFPKDYRYVVEFDQHGHPTPS